jgi:signal transduction histidine kinase
MPVNKVVKEAVSATSENYLNFNFDVSAYRLLGRELITDRITALFELVKNSYDANADNVTVEFLNINPKTVDSKIIIRDDGLGMELSDIQNKWMIIGTSSKRRDRESQAPYKRKVSGKKGVGRFAVDQLGAKLILKTKKKNTNQMVCLETDWTVYSKLENTQLQLDFEAKKPFFTDVKNKYWFEDAPLDMQGTTLEISSVNEIWTEQDITRVYKELSKLVSPNKKAKHPFNIIIQAPLYEAYKKIQVKIHLVEFATEKIELAFNVEKDTQEILQFNKNKGELTKIEVPKRACGPVALTLYYFNEDDKRKYKNHFGSDVDGIKIYRDGIITTPFAEYVADQNKQKDILGIDKRRYSGFFDRLNTRDLLGYLEITDESNSNIIESTNRQDFVDNEAWRELKLFIIEQIQQLEYYLKHKKKEARKATKSTLGGADDELKSIRKEINSLKRDATPQARKILNNIEANIGKLQGTLTKSIKEQNKFEAEVKQKENLYFSLVSLQTYAAMFSHMTKHTIGRIIRGAEYFNEHFPNPAQEARFITISKNIFSEMQLLRKGVDFMLKYAKSDTNLEEINLRELVDNLFNTIYAASFKEHNISTQIELSDNLIITYNRKAIEDVFDNLISNSIKALKNTQDKIIKCSGIISKNEITLLFSDNGEGIKDEDKYRIFDIFFTKTAEEGGAGIGLYMVKTRIEAMEGDIEVIDSEFKPTGATFKIKLPFEK